MGKLAGRSAALEKLAFFAFTPFKPGKEEYQSGKGYVKELANRGVSSVASVPVGMAAGAGVGFLAGKTRLAKKLVDKIMPFYRKAVIARAPRSASAEDIQDVVEAMRPVIPATIGMAAGGMVAGETAKVKAIRKTQRGYGLKPSGAKQIAARELAEIAGAVSPIPFGKVLGDVVARKFQKFEKVKKG